MSNKGVNGLAGGKTTRKAADANCTAIDKKVCSPEHRLGEFEEARGRLISVIGKDGLAVAQFAWGAVLFPEEMHEKLAELEGHEIACLRLGGKYHLRAVR